MNAGMVLQILLNKNHKIFAKLKKSLYLCTAKTEKPLRQESLERLPLENRDNSSVGRAQPCQGSSPVFRSNAIPRIIYVRMAELVDALL